MTSIKKYKMNLLFIYNRNKDKNYIFNRKLFLQSLRFCILTIAILNFSLKKELKFIFHKFSYLLIYKNKFPIFFIPKKN